ncbi:MAG: imidazoleglycerol-phosphate dehydratase HisB [Candidatus Diapherotrites archaeon]
MNKRKAKKETEIKPKRKAKINRNTTETQIQLELNLDGTGKYEIQTGIGFLNHMLEIFSNNSLIDLKLKAKGDIEVDEHHLLEDIGICIGQALNEALGDRKGINRAGFFAYPMDEALSIASIDFSGRPNLKFKAKFRRRYCGGLDLDLMEDFFKGFSDNSKSSLHILMAYGRNDHHKIEAIFKAFGKAVKMAVSKDKKIQGIIPSTKGLL